MRNSAPSTTRRPHSEPRGNAGPGRLSNGTRPNVQDDAEPFNPDNPYHVRTGIFMACSDKCIACGAERVFLSEVSYKHRLHLHVFGANSKLFPSSLVRGVGEVVGGLFRVFLFVCFCFCLFCFGQRGKSIEINNIRNLF